LALGHGIFKSIAFNFRVRGGNAFIT